jgi:hypothetical protein
MLRSVCLTLISAAALGTAASAQPRPQGFGRPADDWCSDRESSDDRARHCEVREATVGGANPIDVDAGRNGGIRVRGSDRGDVLVRARIIASADTAAQARAVASAVRIETGGGRVQAQGPQNSGDAQWSVNFELEVPRMSELALTTHNGGIAVNDFYGTATLTATNGGVSLANVGGNIRGGTTNGGVTVDVADMFWNGTGLDVHTRNGGVRLTLPDGFSAELEVGTTHGRINIDLPITVQGTIGRHIKTTLGSGGPPVRAITTNGGVTVRRKGW